MRLIRLLALLAITATFVLAAGCGGDDDDDDGTTTTEETAAGGGGTTEVSMTEYRFDPADVTVSRGDTISATNDGELTHNYTIEVADPPPEGKPTTDDLDPGEQGALGVIEDPGEYDVICTIPGHAEQGMEGTVTVKP